MVLGNDTKLSHSSASSTTASIVEWLEKNRQTNSQGNVMENFVIRAIRVYNE